MKRIFGCVFAVFLLTGWTFSYKNNVQTGKPDLVTTGAVFSDISSAIAKGRIRTGNGFLSVGSVNLPIPPVPAVVLDYDSISGNARVIGVDGLGGYKPITLNPYGGNILVGTTTNGTDRVDVNGTVRGSQLKSYIATGTPPLVVTSTTPVPNLSIGGNAATADKLTTARTISTTGDATYTSSGFDGTGNATGTITVNQAAKLTTPRAINGVNFDGTAPITIYDSTKAPTASPTFSTGITINGSINIASGMTTQLSATAGSASALPAAPAGYMKWPFDAGYILIPYYNP